MANEIVALTSKAAGCPTYSHVPIRNFLLDSQSFFTRASLGTAVSIPFSVRFFIRVHDSIDGWLDLLRLSVLCFSLAVTLKPEYRKLRVSHL